MAEPTRTPSGRVRLSGIDYSAFQHPLDREATVNLRRLKGFDVVLAKYNELHYERLLYVANIASRVRVGPNQLPQLYDLLREGCDILGLAEPELYLGPGGVNAFTAGHNRPFITLRADLVDLLSDEELRFVIAHELGHIKCGHVLYQSMADVLAGAAQLVGRISLGIGDLLTAPLSLALQAWARRSELSADRAGLLVVQSPRPCLTTLLKLASGSARLGNLLDLDAFLEQARAYTDDLDNDAVNRFYRLMASTQKGDHPFAVERAKTLSEWASSIEYRQILAGDYARATPAQTPAVCPQCGAAREPGARFCNQCGRSFPG